MRTGALLRTRLWSLAGAAAFALSCANIPPEAPTLSEQLGQRVSAIQAAHLTLLHRYFEVKRREVERYVSQEWLPVFTQSFFAQPKIQETWAKVVASTDPDDKVEFLRRIGPKIQAEVERKSAELTDPLDELERELERKLRAEYDRAFAINNSLTAYLTSAADVDASRERYLELVGVREKDIDAAVNQVDDTIDELLRNTETLEQKTQAAKEFAAKIQALKDGLRAPAPPAAKPGDR